MTNGLQVVVLPSSRAPIVTQVLVYKAGSADEVWPKTGVAHFLEHMMFKGTATVGPTEFSRTVSKNGGRDNAYTTYDSTGYYQTVAPDRLELVMRMEADRMAGLRITEKELIPERQVVLEERRMRTDNSPGALLEEAVQEQLFGRHKPYGMPISGYVDDVKKLTVGDLMAFYAKFYAPNNAILIIAGDTTAEQVRKLAEKHYGPVAAQSSRAAVRRGRARSAAARDARRPRGRRAALVAAYLAPSYRKGEPALPMRCRCRRLLGGGETSRLWRALVVDRSCLSAWATQPDQPRLTTFDLGVHPRRPARWRRSSAVGGQLGKLIDDAWPRSRAERRTSFWPPRSIRRIHWRAAAHLRRHACIGGTMADIDAWPQRIAAVTPADVIAAARHVWRPTAW